MMANLKKSLFSVGGNVGSYANDIGCETAKLARRVGAKRGGIALGVLAIAVATPFVVRYLRARNADVDFEDDIESPKPRANKRRRAARRSTSTNSAHV